MLMRTKLLALSAAALMLVSQAGYAADEGLDAQNTMPSGFSSGVLGGGAESPLSTGMMTQPEDEKLPEPPSMAELAGPVIMNVGLEGNSEVASEHIMSVVTTKAGEHVDEEKLRKDAEAIFELGFFNSTDYRVSDVEGGVNVTFVVRENPKVGEIRFVGNTVYSSEELNKIIFTQPGMIFNRTFFRNDLQRVKEKYQADGYVMANVRDVKIDGDVITVEILEPKVSEIVIQGNKITKTRIIERYIRVKVGEKFNSNELRLTLNRLQGLGYFSDVNVNFEPGENPDDVVLVLTVEEARTGRLGFNVAYGTQSGFGGGMSYENSNIWGTGNKLSVGFDLGDRKEYWLTLEQPYMSHKVFAWRVGVYRRAWDDIYYYEDDTEYLEYDRDRFGAFVGFGKKFAEESKFNWYVLLDWHKTKNDDVRNRASDGQWGDYADRYYSQRPSNIPDDIISDIKQQELGEGNYYSATFTLRRVNLDEYLPYQKGDRESINVQVGQADVEGVDYSYVKYWLDGRFYYPIGNFLKDIFETSFLDGADGKPVLLAARVIAGSSSGDVPYDELYEVGGDTTLRGYDDDYYHGRNMVLGNVELRIPIQKMFGLVFFYDIGKAWDSGGLFGRDKKYGADEWGDSPGVGIRLNTPLGNLRLDYANGEEDRFVFGFGELF